MEEVELGPNIERKVKQSKNKKRLTKKLVDVENEKRAKWIHTLMNCESLPSYVAEVLKQEEAEKGHLLKLTLHEINKFWQELHQFYRVISADLVEEVGGSSELVSALTRLLLYTAQLHPVVSSEEFVIMAMGLNIFMGEPNMYSHPELQNEICELSEYCCVVGLNMPGIFFLNTFNFLIDLTLNEKTNGDKKAEIKRMWEMRVPLTRINLRTPSCEVLAAKLMRVVVSSAYLSCKDGRNFIAFTFALDTKMIKKVHQAIKDFLPSCKRYQAAWYGEVYYTAWVNSSPEVRQTLEKECIQNFMTHMFVFPRKKQELSHLGQNVFAILSHFHKNRTISHFSKILTELYMPLLWRHLRSGNNIERCNAAEVFLDIYPLEMPGAGKVEESEFLNKQHNEMVDLLTDDCHVVRIISIKGICHKLCTAWSTFPQESIQVLMRKLLSLANDGSQSTVRRTLYDSLNLLLHNPESAVYLARLLPSMREYLHDENEKVRRSFVKLLCDVKNMPDPAPIKYWKIVTLEHLTARLALEGKEVGSVLVKLLMSNIYSPELPLHKFLSRLTRFIELSPLAARKLFQYSTKVLDYKNALRVMLTILYNLRLQVRNKEEASAECKQQDQEMKVDQEEKSKKRKRRRSEPLQPIVENDQDEAEANENKENNQGSENQLSSDSNSTNTSNDSTSTARSTKIDAEDDYSRPEVSHALFDIVSVLWSLHSNSLADPDHEKDHNNLMDVACAGIPLFLKYYKGTPTYWSVIQLSSLVPAVKLRATSTVCSASISHLKQISEVTPQNELEVVIHAVCAWNRFSDIQDVVVDWLDQAFRCEGLNQSQAPLKETLRLRKVRFVAKGGKPMLALRILDAVFGHPINSRRVLEKSYNHVYELYVYLERIKVLVERRLLLALPFESPMLSDEFLLKCFYRYAKLILILHRLEPQEARENQSVVEPFDASEVFRQFLQWTTRVIRPMIPLRLEEEVDISVLFMKDILCVAANLVDVMYAKEDTILRIGELIQGLLSHECSLWYVESSLIVVKHLKDYSEAQYGMEDNERIMRHMVPALLSQALKSLSEHKLTKEQAASYINNVGEVKTAMWEVVQCLLRMFGRRSKLLDSVLKLFTDALVAIIAHDINQFQLLDTVEKVNELPFICGLLISVMSRPLISSLWLATVPSSIKELYLQDGNNLVAAVSLLHTLVRSGLVLPKPELTAAVKAAYEAVTNYTRDSTQLHPPEQSSSAFSTESIDVKKTAIPVLNELEIFLDCSVR